MSRTEAINTFTDGLVSDLNPINTPNTVLTDCLNGTIITYDGNEYILQNDKGNYPLKDCKLQENYIPVGVKEYGDILYIVSYNPLDKHVEIGSYPSPRNVNDSNSTPGLKLNVKSIQEQIIALNTTTVNYSDITNNMERLEFFYGARPEETKLNPGDKYKLEIGARNSCKYEELEYYVIDENRKTYNISDKIEINSLVFNNIKWNIPGWIGLKPRFANIDDLKINIKRLVSKAYSNTLSLNLNFQVLASDPILKKYLANGLSDIYVNFNIKDENNVSLKNGSVNLTDSIQYNNGTFIYRTDWPKTSSFNITNTPVITIEATPVLKLNINNRNIDIIYDKCIKTLTLNLSKKGDPRQLKIGVNSWWYRTDPESKSFTLKFDSIGLDNASVLSEDVFLSYSIYRLENSLPSLVQDESGQTYYNKLLEDWNLLGETIVEFPLFEFSQSNYTAYPNKFYPEDIYIFEFKFWEDANCTEPLKGASVFKKLVIASELMNDFEDPCYDQITFDRWMGKLPDSFKNKKFVTENITIDTSTASVDSAVVTDESYKIWSTNNGWSRYKTFKNAINADKLENFTISAGAAVPYTVSVKTGVQSLVGPLWIDLLNTANISYSASIDDKQFTLKQFNLNKFTGNSNTSESINTRIRASKQETYTLNKENVATYAWDYETKSLKYPSNPYQINLTFYSKKVSNAGVSNRGYLKIEFNNPDGGNISKPLDTYIPANNWYDVHSEEVTLASDVIKYIKTNKTNFDFMLVNVTIKCVDLNNYEKSRLERINSNWGSVYRYFEVKGDSSNTASFIVFKNKNELLFAKTSGNTINNLFNNIDHIVCKSNKIFGSFYTASTSTMSTIDNVRKLKIDGQINFKDFKMRGIDFLASTRENIAIDTHSSNFKISEEGINGFASLSPLIFPTYEEDIFIPEAVLTNTDSLLNSEKTKIESYNTQVTADFSKFKQDTVYNTDSVTENSNYYKYKTQSGAIDALWLDALNERVNTTNNNALAWWSYVSGSGSGWNADKIHKLGIDLGDF